jgi:hypothetical protein
VVEEVVRVMRLEPEQLAWLLLLTVNRMQGKGSTVRLVVPSDPEVTRELAPTFTENEILSAEEYLLNRGYIAPANIGLTWGTYTITPTGLGWLDEGFPGLLEASPTVVEEPEEAAKPRLATVGAQTGPKRPWWRKLLKG